MVSSGGFSLRRVQIQLGRCQEHVPKKPRTFSIANMLQLFEKESGVLSLG
jgi:hypothetical protein